MQYTLYIREESGLLTRHSERQQHTQNTLAAAGYTHTEQLRGWPESKVIWNKATGYASGWAPIRRQS